MTTARIASSSPAERSSSPSESSSSGVIALSTWGRLRVRVNTPAAVELSSGAAAAVTGSALMARRTLVHACFAKLAQPGERVDAGVVAVGPHRVQAVCADQRDVCQLVLAGTQLGLGRQATREARLAAAGRTRTGPAQDVE